MEPIRYAVQRVDWWAVTGMLILATSAVFTGYLIVALIHFLIRHRQEIAWTIWGGA